MKVIILGVPCRGKTTLCNKLLEEHPNTKVLCTDKLRQALDVYDPDNNYPTEVAPEDISLIVRVVQEFLYHFDNCIVEGSGLSPRDAKSITFSFNIPVILLTHRNTTVKQDLELIRKYDNKNKWTNNRTDQYLLKRLEFYKRVEEDWFKHFDKNAVFETSQCFDSVLQQAFDYIGQKQRARESLDNKLISIF